MSDVAAFFTALPNRIDKERIKEESCVLQFNIGSDPNGSWHLVLDQGRASVHPGAAAAPNVTVGMEATDFFSLVEGKLSGQSAFLMGKLRVQGDMGVAMRLRTILALG
jgi:putative sterol carrier protein